MAVAFAMAGYLFGKYVTDNKWKDKLKDIRQTAIKKSRAVIAGQFAEQLSPFLPDFPHLPTEAKFIGKPIDFVIFKGYDKREIEEVVFVEVKSGKSRLSPIERNLRDVIHDKKVRWIEYRVPEELTKGREEQDAKEP